jgi:hypothetical protein
VAFGEETVLAGLSASDLVEEVRSLVRRIGTSGLQSQGIADDDVEAHCVAVILQEIDRRRRRGVRIENPRGFVRAYVAFSIRDAARRIARGGSLERTSRGTGQLHDVPVERVVDALGRLDDEPQHPPKNDHARFARAYICALTQITDFWRHPPDVRLAMLCAFSRYERDDPRPLHQRSPNALHQAHHRFHRRLLEALREVTDA